MPKYSQSSQKRLSTCHRDLQTVFNEVIKYYDVTIACGHRGEAAQQEAYDDGFSTVQFPNSKHNSIPSMATDAIPYPQKWSDMDALQVLGGFVMGVASQLYEQGKITHLIRWGHDWDGDHDYHDQTFIDAPHFELFKP